MSLLCSCIFLGGKPGNKAQPKQLLTRPSLRLFLVEESTHKIAKHESAQCYQSSAILD